MTNPITTRATSCAYGTGRFQITGKGVQFFGKDKDSNEQPPQWICSPLHVTAKTRDEKNGDWGRLLEWQDDDSKPHQWAMPLELLEGDGLEVRRELARMGVQLSPNPAARTLLGAYLKAWPVEGRARCVDRLGWHGNVFITPSESIGDTDERAVFQNSHAIEPALSTAGNECEWRDSVANLAQGNSRLVFGLSVAFAGALSDIVGEDSGGFHFRGASSSGKSTALKLAASVWGKPSDYMRLWRGTTNGLEGLAALHNDGLLILDEISQIDPCAAGDAAYLLANGQGKARANRNREERNILCQVRSFFEAHGASRFEDMNAANEQRVNNRVGFYRSGEHGQREFLVPTEAFRGVVCQGLDAKAVIRVLIKSGMLVRAKDGKPSYTTRLPGLGSLRVYVIRYIDDAD